MKKYLLLVIFGVLLFSSNCFAIDKYWNPAGAANYNATNAWALTATGTPDQAAPTASDDVFFTSSNSNNCTITAAAVAKSITVTDYAGTIVGSAAKTITLSLSGNITVSGTIILGGNSATNRLLLASSALGTTRSFFAPSSTATVTFSNIDLKDIAMVIGGSDLDLSAITGLSGDAGGNSGMIFTTSDTMTWKDGNGGNWSDVDNWTKTAAAADRVPLPQDDVNLGVAFNASQTVTQDMPRAGRNITWVGATGVPTWTTSLTASIFGSLTLVTATTNMVLTASANPYTFEGRAANMPVGGWTLTSAGNSWAKNITISAVGATYKLLDNLVTTRQLYPTGSVNTTFDANDFDVTTELLFATNYTGSILYMGNGTWTILSDGGSPSYLVFTVSALVTLYCENSTIVITSPNANKVSFGVTPGKVYNKVIFSRGASTEDIVISGSNTFNEFKDEGTEAHTLAFTAGTTQRINTFTVSGSSGKLITLNSTSLNPFYLVKTGGGTVISDYLNIQHSIASPVNTWFAGVNSTNNQSVAVAGSGWTFTAGNCIDKINLILRASVSYFFGMVSTSVGRINNLF